MNNLSCSLRHAFVSSRKVINNIAILLFVTTLLTGLSQAANIEIPEPLISKNEISLFHEVKPRTLKTSSDDVKYTFATDKTAIHFKITVSKPEDYVYRAQENDNVFENEHVRLYLVSGNNNRNAYVFGINHQNAYFDGIYNESAELSLD